MKDMAWKKIFDLVNDIRFLINDSGDMTGAYSVHTIYEGHEIMFHVSTLLPYSKDNKQQVWHSINVMRQMIDWT